MRFHREISAGAALVSSLALAAGALAQDAGDDAPATAPVCERSQFASDTYEPAPAFPGQTEAPEAAPSAVAVEVVAAGLDHPWSLSFLPDGNMLVTERPGRMRIIGADGAISEPLAGVPEVETAYLSGLTDVEIGRAHV